MRYLFILFALVYSCSALAQKASAVKQFHWLEGSWKLDGKEITETWKMVNDSTLGGISSHPDEDGEEIVDEIIKLVCRGESFFYIPLVPNQNKGKEVEFKVTSFTSKSFVAENPAHDFPQKIVYELKDTTHLFAYIEGKTENRSKRITFSFQKKK